MYNEWLRKNKKKIIIGVFVVAVLVLLPLVVGQYRHKRCIEVSIENLNGCLDKQQGSEYITCYDDYGTIEDIEWACGEYMNYLNDGDYGE